VTPAELKSLRHGLGLSTQGCARMLRLKSERTVRKWEAGDTEIPGPAEIVLELIRDLAAVRKRLVPAPQGAE
jgi:DNA-binding transcriptional regulator YiaG